MHMKRTMTLLAAAVPDGTCRPCAVCDLQPRLAQAEPDYRDGNRHRGIHPGNLLHAAAQQVQEDGGGEEQAVVPDAGRSESLQPDRRSGSHRLCTGQTGRCRGIERGRQAGGPGLACRGRQGERTDGTLPAQHRPHSPVWRHAGRTGTLGRILSGVTSAPSTPPRMPTCPPTPSGRKSTCASARMSPGRTGRLSSTSHGNRTPP